MSQTNQDAPVIPPNVVRLILAHRRQRLAAEAKQKNAVAGHKVSEAPTSNGNTTPPAHANGTTRIHPNDN